MHTAQQKRVRNHGQQTFQPAIQCADIIALVGFGSTASVLTDFVAADDAKFAIAVSKLPSTHLGGTNIACAIRAATALLATKPGGLLRRVWLLSDGVDFEETDMVMPLVKIADQNRININVIGFGDPSNYNENRLRDIAGGTRTGKYVSVQTAHQLDRLLRGDGRKHRGEATVFCIDTSGSMYTENMGGRPKIEVVRDTMFGLVRYKQRVWS